VDGALYEMSPPPKQLALPVIFAPQSHGQPQHLGAPAAPGRAHHLPDGRSRGDLRVSTLPTQFGESVVLRVLDRSAVNLEIESLGFPKYIYDYTTEAIQRPNGIIIVDRADRVRQDDDAVFLPAPRQHDRFEAADREDRSSTTSRDHAGGDQRSGGADVQQALRSFLRQDPDIIMVGEMRDLETAQISIQASLTGHLV